MQFERDEAGFLHEEETRQAMERLAELFSGLDPLTYEASLMIGRAWGAILSRLGEHWARYDMTGHRVTVLRLLLVAPGRRIKMKELGSHIGVAPANVTQLVDGLERLGLVRRAADEQDRRSAYVELTAKGDEIHGAVNPGQYRIIEDIFAVLDADEKRQLVDIAAKLRRRALGVSE